MKILILGANGLLGGACFRLMTQLPNLDVFGTVRSKVAKSNNLSQRLIGLTDVLDMQTLNQLFVENKPQVVINCTSLSKSVAKDADPLKFIELYSLLPHRLARLCSRHKARLIHISSDGVFSGRKGNYSEIDIADSDDLYGRSKFLGEVTSSNCITIRTSIIGHDDSLQNGLISWYLSNKHSCKGYTNAIFSGLPVCVLAQILVDYIIYNPNLEGVYHVGSKPISKFELLTLVAEIYDSSVIIIPDHSVKINRSLNTKKFQREALYSPPNWKTLVSVMYDDYLKFSK